MKHLKINEASLVRSDYFAVLISLVAAALVLLPLFTSAKGRESVKVGQVNMRTIDGKRAAVTLTNVSEGNYTLSIESLDGVETFYNESIETPANFAKVFDFSRLEDGNYTLIVKVKNEAKEKHFEIKNGEISIKNELSVAPSFESNGSRALLKMPNSNNKKVAIRVISPEGEELYSTVVKKDIYKTFEFKHVETGKYAVLVSVDNNNYQFDYIKE